jgi:RNA recognition motif-containing protein
MVATFYVSCMPYKFTESDVSRLFEPFGVVRSVKFSADWEQATFHAHAHVEVEVDDVEAVVEALDGKRVRDKPLMVHERVRRADERVFLER